MSYDADRSVRSGLSPKPFVRWPEPSPLDSWWSDVMEGVSANKAGCRGRPPKATGQLD